MYWRLISRVRRPIGRRQTSKEVRELIFRMVVENPTWGAPRIHGELLMLGFDVSERTISRWMKRAPRDSESAKRWLAFLRNHREAIAAMNFFTVPTITFSVVPRQNDDHPLNQQLANRAVKLLKSEAQYSQSFGEGVRPGKADMFSRR